MICAVFAYRAAMALRSLVWMASFTFIFLGKQLLDAAETGEIYWQMVDGPINSMTGTQVCRIAQPCMSLTSVGRYLQSRRSAAFPTWHRSPPATTSMSLAD